MKVHELKCWASEYEAIERGDKTFEVRSTLDRDFAVGDVLDLFKWNPQAIPHNIHKQGRGDYMRTAKPPAADPHDAYGLGRIHSRYVVTHILHGGRFGLPPGLCVMSIKPETKQP